MSCISFKSAGNKSFYSESSEKFGDQLCLGMLIKKEYLKLGKLIGPETEVRELVSTNECTTFFKNNQSGAIN